MFAAANDEERRGAAPFQAAMNRKSGRERQGEGVLAELRWTTPNKALAAQATSPKENHIARPDAGDAIAWLFRFTQLYWLACW